MAWWEGGWLGGHPLAALSPSCSAPCRLKPFTSYKFRVKATNDIGDSEYSEESESLTTLQAGQHLLGQGQRVPPCPGNYSCARGTSKPWASPEPHRPLLPHSPRGGSHHPLHHPPHHHVGAHPLAGTVPSALPGEVAPRCTGWHLGVPGSPGSEQPLTAFPPSLPLQPPAEDKINGILLGFRLRYRELVYDSLRGFALRGIGHPGASWAELTRECPWPLRPWGRVLGWPGGDRAFAGEPWPALG